MGDPLAFTPIAGDHILSPATRFQNLSDVPEDKIPGHDLIQCFSGFNGMLLGPSLPPEAWHDMLAEGDSRFNDLFSRRWRDRWGIPATSSTNVAQGQGYFPQTQEVPLNSSGKGSDLYVNVFGIQLRIGEF